MEFDSVNATTVFDTFLLLLIGIGPKLALVPFMNATAGMPDATKRLVLQRMLVTASSVAIILLVLGGLLTRLLHFSTGALSVASGTILFLTAIGMIFGKDAPGKDLEADQTGDPMQLAIVPLGVPYLLNPAGIVMLVTVSAEADSVAYFFTVVFMLIAVLMLDILVFRWANRVSEHLVENRMLVAEMVFGFLLAALAVQLALNGLEDVGAIHLASN